MPSVAKPNDIVLLIAPNRRRYLLRLSPGEKYHTHRGWIAHDDLLGAPLGRTVYSQLEEPFLALEPSTHDLITQIKRRGQIIFPKEAAHILLRLNVYPGQRVVEAGTGSGGLTLALARSVMPTGRVFSYEVRRDMQGQARRNLETLGLLDYVTLKERDIGEGFDEHDVDALFLDVREPWLYLSQARQALKQGGFFGSLMPTTQQVSHLLSVLETCDFGDVRVEEILVRSWKPVSERLRPADRMIAHTGFLLFARALETGAGMAWWSPDDARLTRRLRQRAEEEERGQTGSNEL